jgi:hypothetical protein
MVTFAAIVAGGRQPAAEPDRLVISRAGSGTVCASKASPLTTALALTDRPVPPLIRPAVFHAAALLWTLATLLLVGVLAASVTELVLRFRRARGWSGCN